MPLPDIKDVGIVASFARWGYPYHGLAVGGVVPVSLRAITQPTGGNTYVQRFSNAPLSGMTAPEIAAEAVLGRTWLDYVILSGSDQQIMGEINIGPLGWIYEAADSLKWWIKITSADTVTGNSQTFTFSVKRFGEFNGTPEEYSRSVVVADIGQSTPTAEFHSAIEAGTGGYDCTVNTYELYLEDIKPNGSQAVIGLRSHCPAELLNWTPVWWAGEPVSMGFLSVTVTDGVSGPDVGITVLYSRADSMGTVDAVTNGYESADRIIGVWFDDTETAVPVKLGLSFPINLVVDTTPCPGSGGVSSAADHVWSFSWGAASATFTAELSGSSSCTCAWQAVPGGFAYVTTCSAAYSYTFDGLLSASSTIPDSITGSVSFGGVNVMRWDDTPLNLYHGCGLFKIDSAVDGTYTGDEFMWAIKRISNKYFGLLVMKFPAGTTYQADPYSAWVQTNDMVWIGGFGPGGNDGHTGALGVLSNVVPSGSIEPVSNLAFLQPDGTPICYV